MPARRAVASLLALLIVGFLAEAHAQPTDDELACRATIAREGRRFAAAKHEALVACNNDVVRGNTCNTARRDARIARAAARLERLVGRACRGLDLAALGYGACADDGTLSPDELATCLVDAIMSAVDEALASAYPDLMAYDGAVGRCQATIARHGETFVQMALRARLRCLDQQARGRIPPPTEVDCRAPGAGTGDDATDRLLAKATARLADKIARACTADHLDALGFPGNCATNGGGGFGVADLIACIQESHSAVADAIIGALIPAPAGSCLLPDPLPQVLSLVTQPAIDLDTGWSGQSHDLRGVRDAAITAVLVGGCDLDLESPTCGQCDVSGPVAFPGPHASCICTNLAALDASSRTACDPAAPACTGGETCECFYGPPLPISSGAVPVCVTNRYVTAITGTANVADQGPHAGEAETTFALESGVHNGLRVDKPCPTCEGDDGARDGARDGRCSGGPQDGEPCDEQGTSEFFGDLSLDCPPPAAANVGNLTVTFAPATTGTTTLGTGPACTAPGFGSAPCFCDTCATLAAEPCNRDADCPSGRPCGGLRCIGGSAAGTPCVDPSDCPGGGFCSRPGEPTRPNACVDATCSPAIVTDGSPDDGVCLTGPFDRLCSLEPFRGCLMDADCNPPPSGNCDTCRPGQVCAAEARECFLDPIVRTGTPDPTMPTFAGTFCISPTRSPAVNVVAGLPGPGALLQETRVFRGLLTCGNGTLDGSEECDPPLDAACPGACQPDCACGPFCGDDMVNAADERCDGTDPGICTAGCEPDCTCTPVCGNDMQEGSEVCDGTDDAACPGACQGDCTCGPFCGDGTINGDEECDGTATSEVCPVSACQPDCTCGPFCGDNVIDPGEECDATMTGSCAGTCAADCSCAPFCGNGVAEGSELCDGADDASCPGTCLADCRCPVAGQATFVAIPGSDLDNGWTGQSHDATVQAGATIAGELGACDGTTDTACTFFADVGSVCSGDPTRACTSTSQCLSSQMCLISSYGAPLPLSSGGVPVCILNRFAEDVVGTFDVASGAATLRIPLNSLIHFSPNVSQPCPVCDCGEATLADCEIGDPGMCAGGPTGACTVEATGPFGPTSNDCLPNPAANISGGGVSVIYDPATTGTATLATDQPCDATDATDQSCWCDGQLRPNACLSACDGGDRDGMSCAGDSDCPGAAPGACRQLCRQVPGDLVGEGQCVGGPADQRCAGAEEIGCMNDAGCPPGTGPCEASLRRCFIDPIVRPGEPGLDMNVLGAAICIPATGASAIDTNTGLPGPGSVRLHQSVDFALDP